MQSKADQFHYPVMRLGIIGGGQLAKMMIEPASRMGIHVTILDPDPAAAASRMADDQIVASLMDPEGLKQLVNQVDVTTYDIEHTNTGVLKTLESEGHRIYPSPGLLEKIQDKYVQKQMLASHGIPVPRFEKADQPTPADMQAFGLPLVQKTRRGGYDGRGVCLIRSEADFPAIIPAPSLLEAFIDFEKEISVLVARNHAGDTRCYPIVEMVVDMEHNILDYLLSPARIEPEQAAEAIHLATAAIEALDGVGVFAVEMLLTREGKVLVNEIAPRPHNSGHFTIEACMSSQFQQHILAVCGLHLGSTQLLKPAVMINLLGAPGFQGAPLIVGLNAALSIPGTHFHFYGKSQTRPYRKMGHVTILDDSIEAALAKARQVKEVLHIQAEG